MPRIILFIVIFYTICLAMLDSVSYNGRYRHAFVDQANYQASRIYFEVRTKLDKMGITTPAVARP